ncbi:serine protease [Tenacibaculum sp. SZ-18]|uniref:trypsin-like peptidase domain-containing protein n=1 Tax=Tenacibaculum sp. SZ-18 TaxID=754423 RepID=UPI000C2D37C9|nr:trypsin-like peptidase domain-containing protein [Tenacibaculum sp. SZ-18]AUC14724.1 serine protease [Tenacibaculum sp. SZ-18]
MKRVLGILTIAFLGGVSSLGAYKAFIEKPQVIVERTVEPELQTVNSNYTPAVLNSSSVPTDFTEAAEKTVNTVVHVKNTAIKEVYNPFEEFFGTGNGKRKQERIGTGSGVIISSDGYIVTNNHVIEGATELEVTLNNKKKYKAQLIGSDDKNDIALLKIESEIDLPYITFGNSDNAKIGEWVLAVGNPYNLNSTVTAGIVSAKGRDLQGNSNIDAFIQTDAAVNSGNSGGALVNTRGELIGINTAISSRTGSFIGYSFAVPSNIAKKIIDDLLEFGNVQEALIGFEPDYKKSKEIEGVKVKVVNEDSGAFKAGIKAGDIITKINNVKITKFSDLKGQLTAKRPGESVNITVNRNGEPLIKTVVLSKRDTYLSANFGVVLKDVTNDDKKKYDIKGGAKIVVTDNKAFEYYNVGKGYIIVKINGENIENASEAVNILNKYGVSMNRMYLEILNLDGEIERYKF